MVTLDNKDGVTTSRGEVVDTGATDESSTDVPLFDASRVTNSTFVVVRLVGVSLITEVSPVTA